MPPPAVHVKLGKLPVAIPAVHGGGAIYFNDVLIRQDGLFVPDDLKPLNPENLK